ncbi:MAG: lipoate--protein ligase family protein [Verrucomicrobiales bacterium]|jgi:lipoate-protein ligase A|nr:lipoate--protein ligase family protein [Verrucomicrobiales bacterium]
MPHARVIVHPPQNRYLNMAIDEALLRLCALPVLRFYQWTEPDAVSIGYFQPHADAHGRPFVRRYTGGGLVDHAGDFTYSVILSKDHPLTVSGTSRSYQLIHEAVAQGLQRIGATVRLAPADAEVSSSACFQKAVRHDVVAADAQKLAGAAQRRTREGCLHQGSVRLANFTFTSLTRAIGEQLLPLLAADAQESSLSAAEQDKALTLERERYATELWNFSR